ncbi:hypothetical protein F4809DRAFT_648731 [Biscogniauxia mediterranea]|nr:hypothetical protein F4809DRAFT_648731 [Biscogniauxia mediterranea]
MHPPILLGFLPFLATAVSAECTREFLIDATDKYLAAQITGAGNDFATALAADDITYTENWVPLNIAEGVLSEPIVIDHNRSIHDTVRCATFTEIIAASNPHPYVIGTRMVFNSSSPPESNSNKISLMESIVTDDGDWAFNATGYLYWDSLEAWDPIPEDLRDARDAVQAAGDAYFDRFADEGVAVPFGTPCARLEGGASTAPLNLTGDSCTAAGMPSALVVTDRRYVVDELAGAVDIYVGFPGLDRSQGQDPMPDSHLFRVEAGEIRYIHTVSACVEDGCGMNGEGPPPPPSSRRRTRRSGRG